MTTQLVTRKWIAADEGQDVEPDEQHAFAHVFRGHLLISLYVVIPSQLLYITESLKCFPVSFILIISWK